MKVVRAAVVFALLAVPAYAQDKPVQRYGEPDKTKTITEIEGEKAAQRAYENSLRNIPAQGPVDPWGTVRSDPPKPAAKTATKTKAAPAAAPAKPGGTAN